MAEVENVESELTETETPPVVEQTDADVDIGVDQDTSLIHKLVGERFAKLNQDEYQM